MKILITGTSQGIGKAIAELFLANQHTVIGIDRRQASIVDARYAHIVADICDIDSLPAIDDVDRKSVV